MLPSRFVEVDEVVEAVEAVAVGRREGRSE